MTINCLIFALGMLSSFHIFKTALTTSPTGNCAHLMNWALDSRHLYYNPMMNFPTHSRKEHVCVSSGQPIN